MEMNELTLITEEIIQDIINAYKIPWQIFIRKKKILNMFCLKLSLIHQ